MLNMYPKHRGLTLIDIYLYLLGNNISDTQRYRISISIRLNYRKYFDINMWQFENHNFYFYKF